MNEILTNQLLRAIDKNHSSDPPQPVGYFRVMGYTTHPWEGTEIEQ